MPKRSYDSELIKDGVVKVDVSSIGTKFENFVQAGCRDLGSHRSRNVYCRKPIILPNLVLFFGTFLELPVLPSITCDSSTIGKNCHLFKFYLLLYFWAEVVLTKNSILSTGNSENVPKKSTRFRSTRCGYGANLNPCSLPAQTSQTLCQY